MICSAFLFGELLADYSPARLVQVIQGAALTTMVLNVVALWKQEARSRGRAVAREADATFGQSWATFSQGGRALRRLLVLGVGTAAFSMEDVLLEPFGGEILHLSVGSTTTLTATLAFGGLVGFGWASRVLSRGMDPFRMASGGVVFGIPAFLAVIASAAWHSPPLFAAGTFLIGLGAGMFGHGTLTATMNLAPKDQAGLALGAWGAVQATCAGVAMAFGGVLRDSVAHGTDSATGYATVYSLEVLLLCITLALMQPLIGRRLQTAT
jgi:BCD family chlorophyll transporter-like MFS transporter